MAITEAPSFPQPSEPKPLNQPKPGDQQTAGVRPADEAVENRGRRNFLKLGLGIAGTAVVGGIGGFLLGRKDSTPTLVVPNTEPQPAENRPTVAPAVAQSEPTKAATAVEAPKPAQSVKKPDNRPVTVDDLEPAERAKLEASKAADAAAKAEAIEAGNRLYRSTKYFESFQIANSWQFIDQGSTGPELFVSSKKSQNGLNLVVMQLQPVPVDSRTKLEDYIQNEYSQLPKSTKKLPAETVTIEGKEYPVYGVSYPEQGQIGALNLAGGLDTSSPLLTKEVFVEKNTPKGKDIWRIRYAGQNREALEEESVFKTVLRTLQLPK
jgi:hypothetical protein